MNMEQFEVFRTIAQTRSFTKTAKILNFTQPAISAQIKLLERKFNVLLCERGNNGVILTEAGKILYEYGDKILALHAEMQNEIEKITNQSKEFINIGASYSVGNDFLPSAISNFKEIYPNVRIRLDIGTGSNLLHKLKERQIDIALVEGEVSDVQDFDIFKIDTNKVILIVANEGKWVDIDSITVDELVRERFILREEESDLRHFADSYLKKYGYNISKLNIIMEITNYDAIKIAVMHNEGVSLVPAPVAQKEIAEGSLKQVEIKDWDLELDMKVVCRVKESLTGLKETFLNYLSIPMTNRQ